MKKYGISVTLQHMPELDPDFMPVLLFNRAFLKGAERPLTIAVERADGHMAVVETKIHGTPEFAEADRYYAERLAKSMLWTKGGELILETAKRVLADEYPEPVGKVIPSLSDETFRRVGQPMAASLPEMR